MRSQHTRGGPFLKNKNERWCEMIISRGRTCKIDISDIPTITTRAFGGKRRWAVVMLRGKPYVREPFMTRGALFMHTLIANPPDGMVVHHKNGNTMDNRKSNLEVMSRSAHSALHLNIRCGKI